MPPEQPKRRSLLDHPAIPYIVLTALILIVLAAALYLLAPEFATTYPIAPSTL